MYKSASQMSKGLHKESAFQAETENSVCFGNLDYIIIKIRRSFFHTNRHHIYLVS